MGSKDLKEEILKAFLVAMDEADYLFKKDGPLAPEDHDTQIRKDTNTSRSRGGFDRDPKSRELRRAVLKQVAAAKASGKPFAWGREGGVGGRDREEYAKRFAKRQGVEFNPVNIEHPETDIEGDLDKTRIGRRLKKKHGVEGAEGTRHAFLAGQGDYRHKTNRGKRWLRGQGVDPSKQGSMYNAAFPEDEDENLRGKTPIGKSQLDINKMRRAGAGSRIKALQKQGYHVGGTYGKGHFKEQIRNAFLNYLSK